jgi:hypothetical protein
VRYTELSLVTAVRVGLDLLASEVVKGCSAGGRLLFITVTSSIHRNHCVTLNLTVRCVKGPLCDAGNIAKLREAVKKQDGVVQHREDLRKRRAEDGLQ